MAWEQRRGRGYYYRSVRSDGRVVKEYLGSGPAAELAVTVDARQREEQAERRRRAAEDRARWVDLERPTAELEDLAGRLAAASLLLAGYHPGRDAAQAADVLRGRGSGRGLSPADGFSCLTR